MESAKNIKTKFKHYFTGSKALFYLINTTFWNSLFGPFFVFIFPLFFILILGNMVGYDQVLGGSFGVPSMAISLGSFPQVIFEFKKSTLLKRIGVTPVKPSLFLLISSLYYFVAMFISIFWCILFSILVFGIQYWDQGKSLEAFSFAGQIYSFSFKQMLNNVNWASFIFGQILSIFTGLSIGMFLVSIGRSTVMLQTVGNTIMITSMFLAVTILSIGLVRSQETFWYLGYVLSPFKPSSNIVLDAWNGSYVGIVGNTLTFEKSSVFYWDESSYFYDLSNFTKMEVLSKAEKIVSIFLPFVWIGLFTGLSIWKFRWNVR